MAVNCNCIPIVSEGVAGVIVIDTSTGPVAAFTVKTVVPLIVPWAAVIVVVPATTAVAKPCLPAALPMVATFGLLDVQVTDLVRSRVLPPVNVPVALNCSVVPVAIEGLAGVTKMEVRTLVESCTVIDIDSAETAALNSKKASRTIRNVRSLSFADLGKNL